MKRPAGESTKSREKPPIKMASESVRGRHVGTQCNTILFAKLQAEKQRKAAQRVQGTQTMKETNTKSVQTLAAGTIRN